jgi:hypothetical protein
MGFDFDENGNNDEYGANENETTGEVGDTGKPIARTPAQPIVIQSAPVQHGNVNDIVAAIMGTSAPVQTPQTVAQALESTQDSYMDEVEERLEIAAYYRSALSNPMFDNDTKAARIVQHEFSGFIRQRLGELLGLPGETKKAETFTEAQIEILRLLGDLTPAHVTAIKMVVARLTGEAPAPREEPVLRQAKAPVTPAPRPAPAPPQRAAPAPAPAAPVTQQAEAPKRGPGRPPGAKNRPPKDTEQMVPAVRKHADGTEEPLYNKDGSPRMVRVQRIQRPAGMMPFPNDAQLSQVTAAQAGARAATLEANPNVQKALTGLQNPA